LRIGVRCRGAQRDRAAAAAKRAPARAIAALKTLPFHSTIPALVELQLGLVPSCMALPRMIASGVQVLLALKQV